MPTMTDIERLTALKEIEILKAQRDFAADTKDWDLYLALHAPDHISHNEDFPPWTSAVEMIANVRKIMGGLETAHHSHTPIITFESATKASGIWAMTGVSRWAQNGEDHWFAGFGHYFETYEKFDTGETGEGKWLFTSRRLKYLHTRSSPGAIFPPPGISAAAEETT